MRRAAAVLAALGALTALLLMVRAGQVGRTPLLLLAFAAALGAAAVLGPRTAPAYRGAALLLLNVLALGAAVELGAAVLLRLLPRAAAEQAPDGARPSYRWAADFGAEHTRATRALRYEPYTIWRNEASSGRLVNVGPDHLRRTVGGDCRPGAFTVFVFGGSTVWGWGTDDRSTIPSRLAAELGERAGRPVCVVNFGQLAYISTQELIELMRQLEAGNVPSLALFYDGANDCREAWAARAPGIHKFRDQVAARIYPDGPHPWRGLAETSATYRLLTRLRPPVVLTPAPLPDDSTARLADAAAAVWHADRRMIAALARDYGFRWAAFLQPWIDAGAKTLTAEERRLRKPQSGAVCQAMYQRLRAGITDRAHVFDLSGVFDTVTASVYVDFVHVTAAGNALVARRIAELLEVPHG